MSFDMNYTDFHPKSTFFHKSNLNTRFDVKLFSLTPTIIDKVKLFNSFNASTKMSGGWESSLDQVVIIGF